MKTTFLSTLVLRLACLLAVLALLGTACSTPGDGHGHDQQKEQEEHGHDGEEHGHDEEGHNDIHIDTVMQQQAGIQVEPVQRDRLHTLISAPAHILPTQEGIAHVGPMIAGRIVRLYVTEGSAVKTGAVLAELEAFGIAELKSDYLRASAETARAQAALQRSATLDEEKIGARRTLEEARAAYQKARAEEQSLQTRLQVLGLDPASIQSDGNLSARVRLYAPLNGIVSRSMAALGEFVQPDDDLFEIVNTTRVWVDARLQPEQVAAVHTGDQATVTNNGDTRRTGTVIFVSPTVDPDSRTVTVRLLLDNNDNRFRPQSFATVKFHSAVMDSGLVVPRPALEFDNGMYYVYRQETADTFERVQVQVGTMNEQQAAIISGIQTGDRIAVDGVFYLKSMRNKEELAEHHH